MIRNMAEKTSDQKRILIVDDSEDMRDLMQQILEEENYQLSFAESGQTAIEQAQEFKPDLILMDMSLPGMSGWEAVIYLRQLADFQHTAIIAVTAHVTQADRIRAIEAGCNGHLGKPFDVTEVIDVIEEFIRTESV
jgi:two-component system, cell cycle response regulator DivK